MAKAILRKTRESKVRAGHPWIYASEIEREEGTCEPGEIIDVISCKGTFLGRALYNPQSQITLRMITTNDEPVDEAFFRRRIEDAWAYRKLLCDPMSCRVIFSESDFLPGLVVDKFADVLSVQTLSLAMDRRKHMLAQLLMEITGATGIYERNDVPVRRHEGLSQVTGLLAGEVPDRVWMRENGIEFRSGCQKWAKDRLFPRSEAEPRGYPALLRRREGHRLFLPQRLFFAARQEIRRAGSAGSGHLRGSD